MNMEGVIDVRNSPVGKQVTQTLAPSDNTTGTVLRFLRLKKLISRRKMHDLSENNVATYCLTPPELIISNFWSDSNHNAYFLFGHSHFFTYHIHFGSI